MIANEIIIELILGPVRGRIGEIFLVQNIGIADFANG
jgi:hypothetical protein